MLNEPAIYRVGAKIKVCFFKKKNNCGQTADQNSAIILGVVL